MLRTRAIAQAILFAFQLSLFTFSVVSSADPAQRPILQLMSDGYLVQSGGNVTATSTGEAIFVWRATNNPDPNSCSIKNVAVATEGGPLAMSGFSNGSYEFKCSNSHGTSILNFNIVKGPPPSQTAPTPGPVDVFLIAGQSNAVGQDIPGQSYLAPGTSNVLRFLNGQLQNVNRLGAWYNFGTAYYAATGRRVVFVPSAVGGSSSFANSNLYLPAGQHWGSDGSLHQNSISAVNSAITALTNSGFSPSLRGVLWVQGETDAKAINAGIISASQYQGALLSVISRYRSYFSNSLPFFIFQTGKGIPNDSGYASVRSIQAQVPLSDSYTRLAYQNAVSFPDKNPSWMWDLDHYMQQGYNEMGTMGGQLAASFLSSLPPVVNLNLYAGSNPNPTAPVAHNSVVSLIDYVRASASTIPSQGLANYFIRVQDPLYLPVEVGPFVGSVEDTNLAFGFIPGHQYSLQVKACKASGACGPYSKPTTYTVAASQGVGIPTLKLYSGTNFQTLVNNSSVSLSSSLLVTTNPLSNIQATKYYLSISYNNGTPVEKGPYTTDFSGTLIEFGFGVGVYNFRIKGCNDAGVCSPYSSAPISLTVY